MDIFDYSLKTQLEKEAPLADRMRPRTLDEFIGQPHILSPGRLLRRAIQADQLSSLIFFGPPGTGKTTLARIIANTTKAQFISINAVLSGVKDIRSSIAEAERYRKEHQRKTILFIDEVHRFNKAQQDALLPHVENGTVILIGATTENPYFEVNKALVSRSRIFQLNSLQQKDLEDILQAALNDKTRGYGDKEIRIERDAVDHLTRVANGDARAVLNALELAVETSEPSSEGVIHITIDTAEESIQQKAVLYDKDGDAHFDTISAFIKSMRGSDPDAALYWMAKMISGGEDPRFLFRRMIIFAGEDVGMADPNALQVVTSAARAFDYVGMPEGRFHLAEACIYLSTAPKSNSAFAFFDALDAVAKENHGDIPNHLRDANRDKKGFGHGEGYLYPHAYRDHWVAQQYLPDLLQGRVFYQPSDNGYEASVKDDVQRRREIQLAGVLEASHRDTLSGQEYWQGRTMENTGALLSEIRDYLFSQLDFRRDNMILVLNADDGVLLGEAFRKVPDGTVYGIVSSDEQKNVLLAQFPHDDFLSKPVLLNAGKSGLIKILSELEQQDIVFDLIIGKNAMVRQSDRQELFQRFKELTHQQSVLAFVDSLKEKAQRLSELIADDQLPEKLMQRLRSIENQIYGVEEETLTGWDEDAIKSNLESAGLVLDRIRQTDFFNKTTLSGRRISEWFSRDGKTAKSYADYLSAELTDEEIDRVKQELWRAVNGKVIRWKSGWVFVKAVQRQ